MAMKQTTVVAASLMIVVLTFVVTTEAQVDGSNGVLNRMLDTSNPIQIAMNKRSSLGKKYDRNCFFSPVQCMLGFKNKGGADMLLNGRR
uniref:Uncharacterized protein n=1 Tax=Plectus sambesii TaxID=2011161 RepID=A0A914XHX8_9BILA